MPLTEKQKAQNQLAKKLDEAIEIVQNNKRHFANQFVERELTSYKHRFCGMPVVASRTLKGENSEPKESRAIIHTEDSFKVKKKELNVAEGEDLSLMSFNDLKVLAIKKYGLNINGRTKDQIIEIITWHLKSLEDDKKFAEKKSKKPKAEKSDEEE